MTSSQDSQGLRLINVGAGKLGTDAATMAQLNNPAGIGAVRLSSWPQRPLGVDAAYAAFPGACVQPNGALRLVWRHGTDHVAARDGVIRTSVSTDNGRNWSPSAVLLSDGTAPDLRDPSISTSSDRSRMWLTYFKGSASLAAGGVFMRTSTNNGATWSAETRVDQLGYAAVSAPVVDLGGGRLLLAYYGRAGGDTFDSCWLATSTDNGATWTNLRVANGQVAGRDYQEPWLTRSGTTVVMTHRYGTAASIGYMRSTDSGQTWTAPVAAFAGGGRPATVWLSTGALVVIYRRLTDGAAVARYSRNGGTSWLRETRVASAAAGLWMNYSAPIEVAAGLAFCPISLETATGVSRHFLAYLADGTGTSPLGDLFLTDHQRAALDEDSVLFADSFNYLDGPLPWPYLSSGVGNPAVSGGVLVSATPDNVPDYALVGNLGNDVQIETDLYYTAQSGHGIVFRWIDANNFLMFTVEGPPGATFFRIYKRDTGTFTQIVGEINGSLPQGVYNRFTLSARADVIHLLYNTSLVFGFVLTAADYSKYQVGNAHGVKVNAQGAAVHRCRRLVVRGS